MATFARELQYEQCQQNEIKQKTLAKPESARADTEGVETSARFN